uniref:Anaphase-promoting complex subunit 2 n=1 Tax=Tanacetum cinerariifolium TaxID=118510 RepID=A0A6L2KDZ8_TANCI|nr:hypothetical protein [Tanacetum cinerariifolium]
MLTDGTGGNNNGPGNTGDSLLEELTRDGENQENTGLDDEINTYDKQVWIDIQGWVPDPIGAAPFMGSHYRRKVDVLGMIVSIIGSKDQLINKYHVMLAGKLLNKPDYDIDTEIRTLELLKVQNLESMRFHLIYLMRLLYLRTSGHLVSYRNRLSIYHLCDYNVETKLQDEDVNIPEPLDHLLGDYAKRYHEIKTPRKLLWKKNLGTVKLELEFEDRTLQFTVTPVLVRVTIVVKTKEKELFFFCITGYACGKWSWIRTSMSDAGKTAVNSEEMIAGDDAERSVASVEDQLRKEMVVYENYITRMLKNFDSMALDRIHNTLKMHCFDPAYKKSLQQLQRFLSSLVAEEKIELRDVFIGTIHHSVEMFSMRRVVKCLVLRPGQRKAKEGCCVMYKTAKGGEEKNIGCSSGRRDCALFGPGSFAHERIWDLGIKIFLSDTLRARWFRRSEECYALVRITINLLCLGYVFRKVID